MLRTSYWYLVAVWASWVFGPPSTGLCTRKRLSSVPFTTNSGMPLRYALRRLNIPLARPG